MENTPTFKNPGRWFSSFPFWAWDDRLDASELVQQISHMARQNVGGFFMHSRDGLETPYMGEEWQRYIRLCIDEAKKQGMYAWLYDEDRWPSGTAGGRVTAQGDAYRCKGITLEVLDTLPPDLDTDSTVLALYMARIDAMDIHWLQRFPSVTALQSYGKTTGTVYLIARMEVSAPSEWFNNQAPPDNLNEDTVRLFLETTHQVYADIAGDDLGKTVPGIFTDEPSLADRHSAFHPKRGWLPWTYRFRDFYQERRHTDILETLPYIYFDGEFSNQARHDYWKTVTELFSEAYSRTIATWCKEHNLLFTGHFLQEDKLGLCTRVNGAVMPHYYYQDMPGIDMLTERTVEYMTVKQCSSVAHQFDKPLVLSETYGCTGWDFTFEGQKWIGDWQFALGVTRRSQHLALYSLKGCRKRDYPPVFNYNTSWWEKNHVVEDYFARLSFQLQKGTPVRPILLIHPASTAWSLLGTNPYGNPIRRNERDVPAIDARGAAFNDFLALLSAEHFDYDLGDELLIERHGHVKEQNFLLGSSTYSTVILYSLENLETPTLDLLELFIRNGGHVLIVASPPRLVDGRPTKNAAVRLQPAAIATDTQVALQWLKEKNLQNLNITLPDGKNASHILSLVKNNNDGTLTVFIVNNDREKSYQTTISIPSIGKLIALNPLDGSQEEVAVLTASQGTMTFDCFCEPAESHLFIVDTTRKPQKRTPRKKLVEHLAVLPSQCAISLDRENTLTLDMCSYSLDGSPFSDVMEVWQMQYQVREKLGMRQIHRNGIEQRYAWVDAPHPQDGHTLAFTLDFTVLHVPEGPVYLVGETPQEFSISLNGQRIAAGPAGYFLDKSFQKVLLPSLQEGRNTLHITCAYKNRMELENWYIAGAFGVDAERNIIPLPRELQLGSWTEQGLFHYCGSVDHHYEFALEEIPRGEILLDIPQVEAVCTTLTVNGHDCEIPWQAEHLQVITPYVVRGNNSVTIRVHSSPRNMLGPFHLKGEKPLVTNDACFTPAAENWDAGYQVVPYGLMKNPVISVRT